MTRVLIADTLPQDLFQLGKDAEVIHRPELKAHDLKEAIQGYEVLVVRSTVVSRETIEAADRLALIVRAGSGVNNIERDAASDRGVFVANCPGKNAVAVAELTLGMILAMDRRLADAHAAFKGGRWEKAEFSKAKGLRGQRLGLLGLGNIAQRVATRAASFSLEVTAFSRSLTHAKAASLGIGRAESVEELFSESDIVSLHVPDTAQTRGLVDARLLSRMKPGALLVNTSRAGVWDESAVIEAVKAKRIRVATDVISGEPEAKSGPVSHAFQELDGVLVSPHIGASTEEAQTAIAQAAADVVRTYIQTGRVPTAVNLEQDSEDRTTLIVRHLDQVGVLAGVLSKLSEAGINVGEMENTQLMGGKTASARIHISGSVDQALIDSLNARSDVLGVSLREEAN